MNLKRYSAMKLLTLLAALTLFYAGAQSFSIVASAPTQLELPAGITTADSVSAADLVYLRISLRWLRDYLPDWYAYVTQAQPFVVAVDKELAQGGEISRAICCTAHGTGSILFGAHLGQWPISEVASVEGMQSQQTQFLSVLVHEVTHIRDQREGRLGREVDAKTCIAAESSANGKELEFARALATVQIAGDASARENYQLVASKHLEITKENFEGVSWKIACLLFHPSE